MKEVQDALNQKQMKEVKEIVDKFGKGPNGKVYF
jgi:hypothetical protein